MGAVTVEATAVVPEGRISPEDSVSVVYLPRTYISDSANDRDYGRIRKLTLSDELFPLSTHRLRKLEYNWLMRVGRHLLMLPGSKKLQAGVLCPSLQKRKTAGPTKVLLALSLSQESFSHIS